MQPGSDPAKDTFDNKTRTKTTTRSPEDLNEHAQEMPNGHSLSPFVDPIPFLQARLEPRLENLATTLSWNSPSENPHPTKHRKQA
jgi:hypothetical protein